MLVGLIRKELLALTRDLHGLAALFVMPVMFIVIMSLALKDLYSPPLRTLRYAMQVQDPGELATALGRAWQGSHGVPQPLPTDWPAQLRAAHLDYVLVLQAGVSAELARPGLPTHPLIQLRAEPGIDGNLLNALRAELVETAGELKARTLLAGTLPVSVQAVSVQGVPVQGTASMGSLVRIERFASDGQRPSAVQQNVPAWLVFGMFFVIASMANLFVQERASGVLARLHSLGVPGSVLLAAKAVPYLAVNAVQGALMLGVGVWLMPLLGGDALHLSGIHWSALIIALGATSLAAVGMALALACAVRTHAQAAAIGPIINVLLAAIGGIMVPKFVMPAFMQRLAELSPMNWGLEALLSVLVRGGDVATGLPFTLRLTAFAALMFTVALLLVRRTVR